MIGQSSIDNVTDVWPTLSEVVRTLTLRAGYNTTIVIVAATLLGVAGGIVGSFTLLRKRSLMADALSHATLPGICLAFIIAVMLGMSGRSLPVLLLGAAVTGVIGIVLITLIIRHTRLTEDAAIGVVLSVFFGAGIVLLSYIQVMPTGTQGGISRFIYGQTAAMSRGDAILMGSIAIVAVVAATILMKEFAVVCFNDDYALAIGWPVVIIDLLMMTLVVLVTVAGLQAVGLILVIAMLIIPPAAARFWTERLRTMVIVAGLIGALSGYAGAATSSLLPRKPAGAVIVIVAGSIFALSMLLAPRRGVIAVAARRLSLRLTIAMDHFVKALHYRLLDRPDGVALAEVARARAWSMPTAWLLMLVARRRGLIERAVDGLRLTAAGRREAARVDRNHRLWEQYLISHADIAPSHVDWSADLVEHVLSPEIIERLERVVRANGAPS